MDEGCCFDYIWMEATGKFHKIVRRFIDFTYLFGNSSPYLGDFKCVG
jgi:hypothetical protein